jgi:hypothetical protein
MNRETEGTIRRRHDCRSIERNQISHSCHKIGSKTLKRGETIATTETMSPGTKRIKQNESGRVQKKRAPAMAFASAHPSWCAEVPRSKWVTDDYVKKLATDPKYHKVPMPDMLNRASIIATRQLSLLKQYEDKMGNMGFYRCGHNLLRKYSPDFECLIEYPDHTLYVFDEATAQAAKRREDGESMFPPAPPRIYRVDSEES